MTEERKKILIVYPSPVPKTRFGGGESHFVNLFKILQQNYFVSAFVNSCKFVRDPFTIIIAPWIRSKKDSQRLVDDMYNGMNLLDSLKYFDYVFVEGIRSDLSLFISIIGRLFKIPVFVKDIGSNTYSLSNIIHPEQNAITLLVQTPFELNFYKRLKVSIEIVGESVDSSFFVPAQEPSQSYFLYVGRITPHKGIEYLIDSLPNDAVLKIVGPILSKKYFQLLTKCRNWKNVEYCGSVDAVSLRTLYQNAIATILPSVTTDTYGFHYPKSELFGLVTLESRACGTPCVVSDAGGLPYTVENGVDGYIVPERDSKALKEVLLKMTSDLKLSRLMGLKGRQIILSGRSLGTSEVEYSKRIKRVIEKYE